MLFITLFLHEGNYQQFPLILSLLETVCLLFMLEFFMLPEEHCI